ncbi:hydroxymethylpyrimidine/phosphomethylpyrimidine kinase [Chelativorans xinjiangense]|uniref:hydroxymethylpyrimidine/phosphomethylpyrimidine kinase n=1 Tax=Chelativorans xinjiangense TaxID=2681485 RepID=UPI00135A87BA|nr:hydroxymethylpyrimidine/phosphomethylpyrimidine kinase [Chelativorans xinjiangense]
MAMTAPRVLVVAGSDSSGGAGLSRDIEAIAAFGLHTALAVTAVTVQTHRQVLAVEAMPPALVADQMRAALGANPVGAIKIGMLARKGTIEAVASVLRAYPHVPAVLDPVLAASSGGALLEPDAVAALTHDLMPLCRLTTPNLQELALLAGSLSVRGEEEVLCQGRNLLDAGAPAVLIKGGHGSGKWSSDILLRPDSEPVRFEALRLNRRLRGTGCMLASAIAALLALDATLEESVRRAKQFVHDHIGRAEETAG